MIRPIIVRWLRWRAAHHDRMTRALGAAVLAHQQARQWDGLAGIWRQREHHRQRRDALNLRASALETPREDRWMFADGETRPPCNHDDWSVHRLHNGDFEVTRRR